MLRSIAEVSGVRVLLAIALLVALSSPASVTAQTPFATSVVDYSPAPGQSINVASFSDPSVALGRPYAGGFVNATTSSIVSLGGFGGALTLAFDHTVEDDPLNPFGMDAIVFGNAFWPAGNPQDHWAECATIEISTDTNMNGLADDAWYLIPGSHIADAASQALTVTWDDDVGDLTYPPDSVEWLPPGESGVWTTSAVGLPVDVFGPFIVSNPSLDADVEGIFGYAEYTPTLQLGDLDGDGSIEDFAIAPAVFFTTPDDPHSVGVTNGSGGGDAFDIAWAIDPKTGALANLPGFDFIRLTTAVHTVDQDFDTGEKSAEIDAVADVAPDPFGDIDDDGDIDLSDVAEMQVCFGSTNAVVEACERADRQPDGSVQLFDAGAMVLRITGPK